MRYKVILIDGRALRNEETQPLENRLNNLADNGWRIVGITDKMIILGK